jgi:bifunctional non-homologous end joining protein LigD
MNPILEGLPGSARRKLVRAEQPEWEEPMLATLTDRRFDDQGCMFGRKLDGVRCIAYRKGKGARLMSRTRHSLNASFPEVADALVKKGAYDLIIDGEVVAMDEAGNSQFEMLQPRYEGLRYDKDPRDVVKEVPK